VNAPSKIENRTPARNVARNAAGRSTIKAPAFTLVETVLALALTAIGLLALLGLIPHGLNIMKTATNISVEARIAQELVGEVMLANWIDVDDFNDTLRYFDNAGVEVKEEDPDFNTQLTYVARIIIPEPTPASTSSGPNNQGYRLPGYDDGDPDLKRVVVHIINSPFLIDLLDEDVQEQYKKKIRVYASTVSNLTSLKDQQNNQAGKP
jgi:uncharacterized protein (TIGR02598 family)